MKLEMKYLMQEKKIINLEFELEISKKYFTEASKSFLPSAVCNVKEVPGSKYSPSKNDNIRDNTHTNYHKKDKNADKQIIMCFDSNRKFINFRKLWTLNGSERRRCSTLSSVKSVIEKETSDNVEYFLISVGTNDTDTKDPETIRNEYESIINLLQEKYPGIKIIVSEVTPRKYNKDNEVVILNKLLGDMCKHNDSLFLVDHSNFRNDTTYSYMFDDKHIHKRAIWQFAGNIKRALRKAYGLPEPQRDGNVSRDKP